MSTCYALVDPHSPAASPEVNLKLRDPITFPTSGPGDGKIKITGGASTPPLNITVNVQWTAHTVEPGVEASLAVGPPALGEVLDRWIVLWSVPGSSMTIKGVLAFEETENTGVGIAKWEDSAGNRGRFTGAARKVPC